MAELECDGGCSYGDGPQEECSAHGRTPKDLWGIIGGLIAERDAALARIAELEAEIKTRTERFDEVLAGREASPEEWRLIGRLETAEARIAEATKLHYRDMPSVGGDWCPEDHHKWPCPTARALGSVPSTGEGSE